MGSAFTATCSFLGFIAGRKGSGAGIGIFSRSIDSKGSTTFVGDWQFEQFMGGHARAAGLDGFCQSRLVVGINHNGFSGAADGDVKLLG